jgi:D-glycerate 3-kinase
MEVIDHIVEGNGPDPVPVPVFDKAKDDRLPESQWRKVPVAPPLIIEGWLMGAEPDWRAPEEPPINAVEAEDDKGIWRAWQEANLAKGYAALWDRADAFLHIDAPSFEIIRAWRIQQEETTLGLAPGTLPPERVAWVERFIQHYERVTRRMRDGQRRSGKRIPVDENRVPSPF